MNTEVKTDAAKKRKKLKVWQILLIVILAVTAALILAVVLLFTTGTVRNFFISRSNEADSIASEKQKENYGMFAEGITENLDISYIDDGTYDHLLDVYYPTGTEGALSTIIDVHGGGMIMGQKEINTVQSRYFASQGFTVVNINYTRMPDGTYADMIRSVYAVLHWIDENAEEYHIDRNHVYMTGDSGGGHIVQVTAAVIYSEELESRYNVTAPSFRVRRFALTCPMVGTQRLVHPDSAIYWLFHYCIGSEILNDAEAMQMADIYTINAMTDYPPVMLITTEGDADFHRDAVELHRFWTENGIEHQYKVYENKSHELGHVFNVSNPEWEESMEANHDIVMFFSEDK